jgi:hypothetical protein
LLPSEANALEGECRRSGSAADVTCQKAHR